MHSKLFVIRPVDDRNAEKVDEDLISKGLPVGADISGELSLDTYFVQDFEQIFGEYAPIVEKTDDGFVIELQKDRIRDFFIEAAKNIEFRMREFRRKLETENEADGAAVYYLPTGRLRDVYDYRIYDAEYGLQNDIRSWAYHNMIGMQQTGQDSVRFKVTQIFDWYADL